MDEIQKAIERIETCIYIIREENKSSKEIVNNRIAKIIKGQDELLTILEKNLETLKSNLRRLK